METVTDFIFLGFKIIADGDCIHEIKRHLLLGKKYVKAVYCHSAFLTSMQSISCEMPGWKKQKLESRLPGEVSITSDIKTASPLWKKAKKN